MTLPLSLSPGSRPTQASPKELFSALPVLHLTALTGDRRKAALGNKSFYTCPIYMQPRRTGLNYINKVTLRTDRDPQV